MKDISKEVFSLKNCDPQKWGELSNILENEYCSENFKKALAKFSCNVIPKLIEKRARKEVFPYHLPGLIIQDDFHFRYFVQVIAQNKDEIVSPQKFICGVLPFPKETYYTFWIREDKQTKKVKIDVFSPHVIEQYARRSKRIEGEMKLPDKWYHIKQPLESAKFKEEEFYHLFLFVGRFFGKNKIYRIIDKKDAYSEREQKAKNNKDRKEWLVSLWPDGLTYSRRFNAECDTGFPITLHTTYLPYVGNPACHSIEEQTVALKQSEAIAEDFALLAKETRESFPGQYKEDSFFESCLNTFVEIYPGICEDCDKKLQFCICFIKNNFTEEKRAKFEEEYKSSKRYSLEEIDEAKKTLVDFRCFTKENAEQTSDALIRIIKCLKLNIQKYNEFKSSNFSECSLLRMHMTSVLTEMLKLFHLLDVFIPMK